MSLFKHRYVGLSAFAGMAPKFPTARFMRQYPPKLKYPAISFLAGTFGWRTKTLEAFIEMFKDRPHLVQVFLSNGPGRRSRSGLQKGSLAPRLTRADFNKQLKNENVRLKRVIQNFTKRTLTRIAPILTENTALLITPELEDNLSDASYNVFLKWVQEAVIEWITDIPSDPGNFMVGWGRSPCTAGKTVPPKVYLELHGVRYNMGSDTIVNLDGVSVDFKDGERYFKKTPISVAAKFLKENNKCLARFLWSANQQGLGNSQGWGQTPPARQRQLIVTDQAIQETKKLLEGK